MQIKHTPMDFLIRDPLHPLLAGGLTKTGMVMEVMIMMLVLLLVLMLLLLLLLVPG